MEIIAEHTLHRAADGGAVPVRIYRPEQHGPDWTCTAQLGEMRVVARGKDSFQALRRLLGTIGRKLARQSWQVAPLHPAASTLFLVEDPQAGDVIASTVATRAGAVDARVSIYRPEMRGKQWACRYFAEWPTEGTCASWGLLGVDKLHALRATVWIVEGVLKAT